MSSKDWWVIEMDGEFFAVEDKHDGIKPKMLKGNLVGIVSFNKPVDAIDYIKFVEANKPMRRSKNQWNFL